MSTNPKGRIHDCGIKALYLCGEGGAQVVQWASGCVKVFCQKALARHCGFWVALRSQPISFQLDHGQRSLLLKWLSWSTAWLPSIQCSLSIYISDIIIDMTLLLSLYKVSWNRPGFSLLSWILQKKCLFEHIIYCTHVYTSSEQNK